MTCNKSVGKLRCHEYAMQVLTGKVRVWILVVTTLLLLLVFANMSAFNFTIICMIPPQSAMDGLNTTNGTNKIWSQEKIIYNGVVYYNYSSIERNALFSASALGLLLGCFPLSYLASKYKIRHTFCTYALISALTTLLIPASVEMGYPFLFTLRVLQGSGSSPSLMMINSVTDQWSPIATAGTFLIMLSTYCQFGPILTMPAAAGLCESRWGWPMVYYLQGTLTLVLLLIFFAFFRVSPREHPLVEQQELLKIQKGKEEILKENRDDRKNVPYRSIVTDYMVWICWLGFFGDELGYQIFQQYGPIFLNKALGMNVRDTGIAAALPFIVAIVTKLIAGPISDRMTCVSDRARINIFSIVSQVGTIVCYACLAVIPKLAPNSPIWLMQIFYTSINIFSG